MMLRLPALCLLSAAFAFLPSIAAAQVDEDAAVALAKRSGCLKCHSIEKRKKGPSYKEIAVKYKGNPNAEKDVFLHITGNPVVKPDSEDEKHIAPDTKDQNEINNLVRWILLR